MYQEIDKIRTYRTKYNYEYWLINYYLRLNDRIYIVIFPVFVGPYFFNTNLYYTSAVRSKIIVLNMYTSDFGLQS